MADKKQIEDYRDSDNELIRTTMEIQDKVTQLPLADQKLVLGVIKGIEMCSQKGA